jgi:hypothetical protein
VKADIAQLCLGWRITSSWQPVAGSCSRSNIIWIRTTQRELHERWLALCSCLGWRPIDLRFLFAPDDRW